MKHDEIDRELAEALDSLREVPLPDEGRQAAQRIAFLAGAREQRQLAESQVGSRRRWEFSRPAPALSQRWAVAGIVTTIVLALLLSTGGVIYAADAAVPGDPLYGVDQAVESARLGLTHRPESVLNLLLSLAEERLAEAEALAAQQDEDNLGAVLEDYGATVSSLAQTLGTVEGADRATLTALLDQAFSDHDVRLTQILGPAVVADVADEGVEEATEEEDAKYCVGADPHPTAQTLAETYDVSYEEIMDWFCDEGYGLGEIKHALQTSAATGESAADLLARKDELGGWGEVWQDLGLIGSTDDDSEEFTEEEEEDLAYCVGVEPHPVAQRLAETYDVAYEDIITWFCEGRYGLGEIKHALQTSAATGESAADLLARKDELGGWGEVWQDLGLIGSTDDDSEEFTEEEEEELAYCVGVEPHPVAQRLAEIYDVAYEDVMTWFCEGRYGLGEIMHALQTSDDEDGNAPEQILLRKTELGGWGQVWQEQGLIGKPDDKPDKDAKDKPAKPTKTPKVKPDKKEKPDK